MLKQKLILSYTSKFLVQILQMVAGIVVGRIAGPSVLGTVSYATAFVSMFLFVADLGISTAHMKFLSEGRDRAKCITAFSYLKLISMGLFSLVVIGAFFFKKYIWESPFESDIHEQAIWISFVAILLNELYNIPRTTFAAFTEQAKQDIPQLINGILFQIIRIVVVILGFGAVEILLGRLASLLVLLPMFIYLFKDYKFGVLDKGLIKDYMKISVPVIFIGMSTMMIGQVDKVFIQELTDNSEQVGFYSAGFSFGGFILLISNSVGLIFFPLFSQAVVRGDYDFISEKIQRFERFSLIFIMPMVTLLAIFSEPLILVTMGINFMPSIPIMITITFSMFVMVLNMPYGNVITGTGNFVLAAYINMANLLFFGLGMYICIESLGMEALGAAFGVLGSNIFLGLLYRYHAKKKCRQISFSATVPHMLYGLVGFCLFQYIYINYFSEPFLSSYGALEYLWKVAGKLSLFTIAFLLFSWGGMYVLKLIDKSDINDINNIIDVKSLLSYVKGELKKDKNDKA